MANPVSEPEKFAPETGTDNDWLRCAPPNNKCAKGRKPPIDSDARGPNRKVCIRVSPLKGTGQGVIASQNGLTLSVPKFAPYSATPLIQGSSLSSPETRKPFRFERSCLVESGPDESEPEVRYVYPRYTFPPGSCAADTPVSDITRISRPTHLRMWTCPVLLLNFLFLFWMQIRVERLPGYIRPRPNVILRDGARDSSSATVFHIASTPSTSTKHLRWTTVTAVHRHKRLRIEFTRFSC